MIRNRRVIWAAWRRRSASVSAEPNRKSPQVAVAEALPRKLPVHHRFQQGVIFAFQRTQAAHRTALPGDRTANAFGQLAQRCRVLHGGQRLQIPLVGRLREGRGRANRPPLCAIDAASLSVPTFLGCRFDFGVARMEDRRLHPQHRTLLVVHLHRVFIQPMLDPHAFGATQKFGLDLAPKMAGHLFVRRGLCPRNRSTLGLENVSIPCRNNSGYQWAKRSGE